MSFVSIRGKEPFGTQAAFFSDSPAMEDKEIDMMAVSASLGGAGASDNPGDSQADHETFHSYFTPPGEVLFLFVVETLTFSRKVS